MVRTPHRAEQGTQAGYPPARPPRMTDAAPWRLAGDVLLVEDNALIAMEAEELLLSLGAGRCHVAANLRQAITILREQRLSFAMLDYMLGEDTSEEIGNRLADSGIPFIFASGYDAMPAAAQRFAEVPVVVKPYSRADVERAVIASRNGPAGTE
jgi:CheY-like chemotaxis protein